MLTAMLAVENIQGARHDLWQVNAEQEYHEEAKAEGVTAKDQLRAVASTQPLVPQPVPAGLSQRMAIVFARLDKLAFATACGVVAGTACLLATVWASFNGGALAEAMALLAEFLPGYQVSVSGGVIASAYVFFWTFLWAWLFAYLRNFSLAFVIYRAKRKAEILSFQTFLDHY